MAEIDRIVRGLVESDVPLERSALLGTARDLAHDVAPLADDGAIAAAVDAIVGLGPLEDLVADADVTDVLVNRHDEVWVERSGELERTDVRFVDDAAVVAMVRRLIAPLGLRIDLAQPAVDARLPDGSRLHAIIPPAAVDGPVIAIRRFHAGITSLGGLVAAGGTDAAGAEHLADLVASRANILIAGPTGAGKTTVLNILCRSTAPGERIVTVEDAAELTPRGHSIRLEARSANVDGAGGTTLRDLVRHALRLRPDRIIVGEVRGAEALLPKPRLVFRCRVAGSVLNLGRFGVLFGRDRGLLGHIPRPLVLWMGWRACGGPRGPGVLLLLAIARRRLSIARR